MDPFCGGTYRWAMKAPISPCRSRFLYHYVGVREPYRNTARVATMAATLLPRPVVELACRAGVSSFSGNAPLSIAEGSGACSIGNATDEQRGLLLLPSSFLDVVTSAWVGLGHGPGSRGCPMQYGGVQAGRVLASLSLMPLLFATRRAL